ncbi:hypothetical protein ACFTTN_31580 [Streptomyces niveus]|uniref:hypothetical protein n=1 Tax=Streptomyces niveus TaxID=193462 RepID=UPI00363A091F
MPDFFTPQPVRHVTPDGQQLDARLHERALWSGCSTPRGRWWPAAVLGGGMRERGKRLLRVSTGSRRGELRDGPAGRPVHPDRPIRLRPEG